MAAIQTMKRSDKQKEPAALIFSKAAGSKWARGYVCCTTAFFLLPSCGSYILGDNQLSILFIAVLYILFVRLWEARHTELQPIPALHEWALPSDE